MVYFLAPLTGTKDDSFRSVEFDNLGDTSELEALERGTYEENRNINERTYDDNVSLYLVFSFSCLLIWISFVYDRI